ncbi:DUF3500 domain-containing protein [soil metagenome]
MKNQRTKKFLLRTFLVIGILILLLWLNKSTIRNWLGKKYFEYQETESLDQEYRGIETDSGKVSDLFPINSTGASTESIRIAANNFISNLTEEQKTRTLYDINDEEWRKWSNVDNGIYVRQGVSLKEMSARQKTVAFDLMEKSLSAKGLKLSKDIMKTDQTLKELKNGSKHFDEELYFFTIMGTPSESEPWGWQLDGHHLVINYFILGDQIVMSPVFMGAEPVITSAGKYKGNTLFQDEQNMGLQFMKSLSDSNQREATLSNTKNENNNKTEAFRDNVTLNYEGLKASKLSSKEKESLLNLIEQYINNIRDGHRQVKMNEVKMHIDQTWFSWVGETPENSVFYYRIHSPVVLIEFDHQRPVGIESESEGPTKNHIHTVVRTPNGNDYGKDLLRQHKEKYH